MRDAGSKRQRKRWRRSVRERKNEFANDKRTHCVLFQAKLFISVHFKMATPRGRSVPCADFTRCGTRALVALLVFSSAIFGRAADARYLCILLCGLDQLRLAVLCLCFKLRARVCGDDLKRSLCNFGAVEFIKERRVRGKWAVAVASREGESARPGIKVRSAGGRNLDRFTACSPKASRKQVRVHRPSMLVQVAIANRHHSTLRFAGREDGVHFLGECAEEGCCARMDFVAE